MTYGRRSAGRFRGTNPLPSKTPPEKLRAALNREWERFVDVRTRYSCGLVTQEQFERALDRLKRFHKRAGMRMLVRDEELRDMKRPVGPMPVG